MAVVQISKIQLRRGKKNSPSGVPQLSSAEMAWAVDSQELFIGNGSVAEGAPYVGNTKILTEHDNILELANSYQYAAESTDIVGSVPRSLQEKLDEYVSIADFKTDDITYNEAFDIAFDNLFKNVDPTYRKVLVIPNGIYTLTEPLQIPSRAIIRGETRHGVVLDINDQQISFEAEASQVSIENLTIERSNIGRVLISGLSNSKFVGVTVRGEYELGDSVSTLNSTNAAIEWQNNNLATRVTAVTFEDCEFVNTPIGIKMSQTSDIASTDIVIKNSKFFKNHVGVYVETPPSQRSVSWQITDTLFEEIASSAVKLRAGSGFRIHRSNFIKCGNGSNLPSLPEDPIVDFGSKVAKMQPNQEEEKLRADWVGNVLIDCYSDRPTSAQNAVTEVLNGDKVELINRHSVFIERTEGVRELALFTTANKFYNIEYQLSLGDHIRNGKLTILVGAGADPVSITDHYQFSPLTLANNGGEAITDFEFSATTQNHPISEDYDLVVLRYTNPVGDTGFLTFDVTYGV